MSVLGTNTLWGGSGGSNAPNSFYVPFAPIPANISSIGTIAPNTNINVSSICSDRINLDGVALDGSSAGGGQLLINGVAVATVNQNVSSIANWATYPALSSITYSGSGGTGGKINMNIGQFSTLQNGLGSISSLTVSSINGYAADSTGGTIIDTTNTYFYSTSNANNLTTTAQSVAGVANGLYTLVTGKKYLVTVPITGYNGDYSATGSQMMAGISLGSASTITFPVAFDSASSSGTAGAYEPKVVQGVVTATGTDGGLQLWLWTGNKPVGSSSVQVYVNATNGINGGANVGVGITIQRLN